MLIQRLIVYYFHILIPSAVKFRRGRGLHHVAEFLQKVFTDSAATSNPAMGKQQPEGCPSQDFTRCFRVHVKVELSNSGVGSSRFQEPTVAGVWGGDAPIQIDGGASARKEARNVCLSYWCLSPGRYV